MKRLWGIVLVFIIVMVTGCGRSNNVKYEPVNSAAPSKIENKPSQGITFNKIKFETLKKGDIPKGLADKIERLKKSRGFIYDVDEKSGYIYIAVFMGEKPTGGYSIQVTDVGDSEGRTEVVVKETFPSKGMMVTQAITEPYTVIKAIGITPNITIKNTEGETFNKL